MRRPRRGGASERPVGRGLLGALLRRGRWHSLLTGAACSAGEAASSPERCARGASTALPPPPSAPLRAAPPPFPSPSRSPPGCAEREAERGARRSCSRRRAEGREPVPQPPLTGGRPAAGRGLRSWSRRPPAVPCRSADPPRASERSEVLWRSREAPAGCAVLLEDPGDWDLTPRCSEPLRAAGKRPGGVEKERSLK